jgi:DNA-binding transcriptional LysR family regulator
MTIKQLDLNFFKVFDAVMRTRSVAAAARELGLTSSAVSHTLARLRQAFGDDLFVLRDGTMQPTPFALELEIDIVSGLSKFAAALRPREFKPASSVRTFRIAAGDYFTSTLFPRLLAKLATEAPGVNVKIFPCNRLDVVEELDQGHIDLALGWFADLPERMIRKTIMLEQEALVVRRGHPLSKGRVTVERLLSYPRLVVELSGSEEVARDGFHHERGVSRRVWIERLLLAPTTEGQEAVGRVAVTVPYFTAVAPIIQATDMVAVLPRRLALQAAKRGQVVTLKPPYVPASVGLEAIFQQEQESDQGLKWIIDELAASAQDLGK